MDLSRVPFLRPALREAEPPAFADPDFVPAAEWLARAPDEPRAVVLGAPFAGGSISRARCDLAPAAVRRALERFSVWSSDWALSLESLPVLDAGDVGPDDDVSKTQERIAAAVAAVLAQARVPLVLLGGDNSVTVGGARGADADALLTFDAHHDCRDPARGPTNGSPVRQLIEGGLQHVVQIGIHGFSSSEANARWAIDHKVHAIPAARVRAEGIGRTVEGALRILGPRRVWVDFDLDVLDRAFAPGAPGAMPGGLSPPELQYAAYVLGKDPHVAGIDLTEVDPEADVSDVTVRGACAVLLAFLAGVTRRAP